MASKSFEIGVKYGQVKRIIGYLKGARKSKKSKIEADMKEAGLELLDYLIVRKSKTLESFLKDVNDWLSLEAKMNEGKYMEYKVGNGEEVFALAAFNRLLFMAKNK
jgi:hypothetical protein